MSNIDSSIQRIWLGFLNRFEGLDFRNLHLVFGPVFNIYTEAIRCYAYETYLASAMLCRSALESTLYLAITRTFDGSRAIIEERNDEWNCMKEIAQILGILSSTEKKAIDSTRELGNFSAHYAAKFDKRIIPSTRAMAKAKTAKESLSIAMKQHPIKVWIDKEDARKDLDQTANWIHTIITNYFKLQNLER